MLLRKYQRQQESEQRCQQDREHEYHWRCPFQTHCWNEGLRLPSVWDSNKPISAWWSGQRVRSLCHIHGSKPIRRQTSSTIIKTIRYLVSWWRSKFIFLLTTVSHRLKNWRMRSCVRGTTPNRATRTGSSISRSIRLTGKRGSILIEADERSTDIRS